MSEHVFFEVRDLDVYYDRVQALDGVSISIDKGEIVSVIGPNGAGKTTMLNTISGDLEYDGDVVFGGTDLSTLNEQEIVEQGVIHCTEDRDLFPFFTVHENLLMGAHLLEDAKTQNSSSSSTISSRGWTSGATKRPRP